MKATLQDVLSRLNQAREAIGRLDVRSGDLPQRAALVSELLAACRELEERERELQALRQSVTDNQIMADVGEVASPVAHEVNNFLNALFLHVAVLELQLTPQMREGVEEIRQQGRGLAALVHRWQNYRRPSGGSTVDVNQPVAEAVHHMCDEATGPLLRFETTTARNESSAAGGVPVRLRSMDGPLWVAGRAIDLQRVCTFLLRNAAAVTPADGTITVRTGRSQGKVLLSIEDTGPGVAPEKLLELFAPYPVQREGTDSLELAACKSLVRRLQGNIAAENNAAGGITVTVELPAEQSE